MENFVLQIFAVILSSVLGLRGISYNKKRRKRIVKYDEKSSHEPEKGIKDEKMVNEIKSIKCKNLRARRNKKYIKEIVPKY